MKIKIGNFNFINDSENKIHDFSDLKSKDSYFWIDGKENKLFVLNMTKFEPDDRLQMQEFEKKLIERFEIVPFYKMATKEVNDYINDKVENLINTQNYSKYHLYKNIGLYDILKLRKDTTFQFSSIDDYYINFDTNKIGKFRYNPYYEKIENMEECQDRLKSVIKKNIILKEIEKGIAPKFITEIMKIEDFLKDKKSCYLIFNGTDKKFPLNRVLVRDVIDLRKYEINLGSYSDKFEIKDLKGLMYGRKFLEINPINFVNIDKQIAISFNDRLEQRIDYLKEKVENDYINYRRKKDIEYYDMPDFLNNVIEKMNDYDEEKPKWFTKQVEEMCHKFNLINYLEKINDLPEIREVCMELKDEELQDIVYNMSDTEEVYLEEEIY